MAQSRKDNPEREVTFEVLQHLGVLSTSPRGWTKELNLVKWNEAKPKYDLRDWNEDHSKMSRGVTFTKEEAEVLLEMLGKAFSDQPADTAEPFSKSADMPEKQADAHGDAEDENDREQTYEASDTLAG